METPVTTAQIWWTSDLRSVFPPQSSKQLHGKLASIACIAEIIGADMGWNRDATSRAAYRMARYWLKSGKWDLILAALHCRGETARWPTSSRRWGSEPFNRFGYPHAGFLTIISLRQADLYRRNGGPSPAEPFPLQKLCRLSLTWRHIAQYDNAALGLGNDLDNPFRPLARQEPG